MYRYEAAVRISEALAACHEPEELAEILADQLSNFLSFNHLDVVVLKEDSNEIEWQAWGKGSLPLPEVPVEELSLWQVYNSQEPLHIADWNKDERFPHLKQAIAALGLDTEGIGSVVRVPLTTPHRRLGTFGIAGASGVTYSADDVSFLRLIARVVAFAIDDGLNLRRAREVQTCLQHQNDRLELLMNLTNSITSNLDLKDLLQAITLSVREVMQCRAVAVSLPDRKGNVLRLFALDIPGNLKLQTGHQISMLSTLRAYETGKPAVTKRLDLSCFVDLEPGPFAHPPAEALHDVLAEAGRSFCDVPLIARNRVLGVLTLGRSEEDAFGTDDVQFIMQAAGQVAIAIENALAYQEISELKDKLAQEKLYLEEEIRSELNFEQIVGASPALKHVLQLVETVAPSDSTVLLLGETGTGKELIARAIHDRSRRKERTFVKLNCAAIPTGLLESELFGHEKGAFTGAISQKVGRLELADQGTLFLDEVGDIPIEIQPKLLRALQEREFERLGSTRTRKVNVRLIAATNRDLERMIANREFRSDLFYRLNVFPIRIPPLRNRREDIPLLVSYFVQKFAKQMQKKIETIPSGTMKGLKSWEWPGNIRELENFIERAVILTRGKSLQVPLSELRKPENDSPATAAVSPGQEDLARIVKETISAALQGKKHLSDEYSQKQREEIVRALTESKGRVGGTDGAAARIGINRTTLISRMKKLGIDPRQYS